MSIENKIDQIQADILLLSEKITDTKEFAFFVSKAITASSARAALWDSKLSIAARLTVASSVMDYVSYILDSDINYIDYAVDLNKLIDSAIEFAPLQLPKHVVEKGVKPPVSWEGKSGGPFTHSNEKYPLRIIQKPLLPGGNWVLLYYNIPISFGRDVEEVANKAIKIIELRDI